MKKLILIGLICGLTLLANAGQVQIGTLSVGTASFNGGISGSAYLDNLTDNINILVTGFSIDGIPQSFGQETVVPQASVNVLGWNSAATSQIDLFGTLSSNTFSIGGVMYNATNPMWSVTFPASTIVASAQFHPLRFSPTTGFQQLNITVDATPVSPTPEPASATLLATALFGLLAGKSLRGRSTL